MATATRFSHLHYKRLFASSIKNGGLPNITGTFKTVFHGGSWDTIASGVFAPQETPPKSNIGGGSYLNDYTIGFDASRVSSVYGSGATVRPAAVYTNWCVKF